MYKHCYLKLIVKQIIWFWLNIEVCRTHIFTLLIISLLQILTGDDNGWKLVTLDENKHGGLASPACHTILRSPYFRMVVMCTILANGITTATMSFKHDEKPRNTYINYDNYYWAEIAFTILLDLETLFKIWCLGFRSYYKHSIHKFELLLAIGTTIHIIPIFYLSGFTYFKVSTSYLWLFVFRVVSLHFIFLCSDLRFLNSAFKFRSLNYAFWTLSRWFL